MTITQWSNKVNKRFYGFNEKPKDRAKITEYISGRTTAYNTNTRSVMSFTCSLKLTKKELAFFWEWFNDELGGTAGIFDCSALGNKHYRFTDIPDPQNTEQSRRILSMSIEEVY